MIILNIEDEIITSDCDTLTLPSPVQGEEGTGSIIQSNVAKRHLTVYKIYPMNKKIGLFVGLILLAASCSRATSITPLPQTPQYNYNQRLLIGAKILLVEIVSDENKMQTGLSNREKLGENNGMLFDFGNKKVTPNFWMKDMLFDIDLIWIADKKIIGIMPNVNAPTKDVGFPPEADPPLAEKIKRLPTYSPPAEIDQVLEVNSGWSKKNNIKIGDAVGIRN